MKKFVYLCGMILLSMNMMAQIDLNDKNWHYVVNEPFNEGALHWQWDTERFMNKGDYSWKAYPSIIAPNGEHEVYQFDNCQINTTDSTMQLVAYYDSTHRIQGNEYYLPKWMWIENGGEGFPSSDNLFYFSGALEYNKKHPLPIENDRKFLYGYFQIHCKMPISPGAHPAFWLQASDTASSDPYYEEIDIFEYSGYLGSPTASWLVPNNPHPTYEGDTRVYSTGICHNLHGQYVNHDTDNYAVEYVRLPNGQEDIGGWHTYSCEWLPDHVHWYLDGNLVNSYYDQAHIPRHSLVMKTNYAIDNLALEKIFDTAGIVIGYEPAWMDSDTLTIDYIRVYQLGWDCDTDEVIACQNDLTGFDYKVKKSIGITSSVEEVVVEDDDKITLRVTDSFEITGPFQADSGCEFTVIRQDCPE